MESILCSWNGRINIVKISVLPKAIYRLNAIPFKTPVAFLTEVKIAILKFLWNHKRPQIAKASSEKEEESRRHHTSDLKLYNKAVIIKRVCYWHKNRHIDQWNTIQSPEIKPMHIWSTNI